MKNVAKKSKVLVSALVLTMVVAMLAACGSSSNNALIGTWSIDTAVAQGITLTGDEIESMGYTMTFEFKTDGTVTVTGGGLSGDGTYTLNGTTVTITADGSTMDLKLEDDTLTFEESTSGVTFNLKK